jgi:hypothetical protein
MSMVDPERLARLVDLACSSRARLADPGIDEVRWEIELYTYDDALVTLADFLDVPVSGAVRDEMAAADRYDLEEALIEAGVDLFGAGPHLQLEPPGADEAGSSGS